MNHNRYLANLIPGIIILFFVIFSRPLKGQEIYYPRINEKDSLALVELYNTCGGANWNYKSNWLAGRVHTWNGITVIQGESRVRKINLYLNNITGTLPQSLVNLTGLEELIIHSNKLSGSVPDWFDKLPALKKLDLHDNQFTTIPASLGNCSILTGLDLSGNSFTGEIPGFLGNIISLVGLRLDRTGFTGSIPPSFRNLTNLVSLEISHTNLDGTGHLGSLAGLTKLSYLVLAGNKFSGPIPVSIGTLTKLTTFSMLDNRLSDTIPGSIGNLLNLEYFELGMNKLTGVLPSSINNLTKLTDLKISNNGLSGLPKINLPKLKVIQLFGNRFTFEDLIPNVNAAVTVEYAPQDSTMFKETYFVEYGRSLTLEADDAGGTNNTYAWFRNGIEIPGSNLKQYTLENASRADSGSFYVAAVKNPKLPGLTLFNRPKKVLTDEFLYPEKPDDWRNPNLMVVVVGLTEDVLVSIQGREPRELKVGQVLTWGDEIMTGILSDVEILLPDMSKIKIREMSAMKVGSLFLEKDTYKTRLLLKIGELEAQVNPKKTVFSDFSVQAPVATASVRGTSFGMRYDSLKRVATVIVAEGDVVVKPEGYLQYKSGTMMTDSVILTDWKRIAVTGAGLGTIESVIPVRIEISPDTTWLDVGRKAMIFASAVDLKGFRTAVRVNCETGGGSIDSMGILTAGKYSGFYVITATEPAHKLKANAIFHVKGWTVGADEFQHRKIFHLGQNFPNPFSQSTNITFRIEKPGQVQLIINDLSGRLIQKVIDEFKQPGLHEVVFRAGNLNPGMYFYSLISGISTETKKMVIH